MSHCCRITNNKLIEINNFGKQPLGNGFLDNKHFNSEYFYEMRTGFDDKSKMFQLFDHPSPDQMFHANYPFISGTSMKMKSHFKELANKITKMSSQNDNLKDFILEIGCNDGILLENFDKNKYDLLGIEPSLNVAEMAREKNIDVLNFFFNSETTDKILNSYRKPNFILAANVICHIPNICGIALNIKKILDDKGFFIFEEPYLGDVIKKISYDQIYDEHVFLFSANSIKFLFNIYGMELIDVENIPTHGGSMRYTICHKGSYNINKSVNLKIDEEKNLGITSVAGMKSFNYKVLESKKKFINLLTEIKRKKLTISGYGATSKSSTILNYCKIGSDFFDYISDTTPTKIDKFSPGMHIPIKDNNFFKANPTDYTVMFAWNHSVEILEKEKNYLLNNGKWIILPTLEILK